MADEDSESESCFSHISSYLNENKPGEDFWSKVLIHLEKLKLWSRLKENRSKISKVNIDLVKRLIETSHRQLVLLKYTEKDDICQCLQVLTEAFRLLRNCCAEIQQKQELAVKAGIVDQVKNILSILLKPQFQEPEQDLPLISAAVKSGIQLLGNIVVGNKITGEFVWQNCFPSFFLYVLTCGDRTCQECLCMVIYNCLNSQNRAAIVNDPKGCRILAQILQLVTEQKELEWGYFVLNSMLSSHLIEVYKGLHFDPCSRIILLDLINAKLSEMTSVKSSPTSPSRLACGSIQERAMFFLAEQFVINGKTALLGMKQHQSGDNILEAVVFSRLLSVLCTASALHDQYNELVNNTKLLETALDLLRETNKEEYKDIFYNQTKFPTGEDSGEVSPSHGFKRDLVQLLGNMSYQNRCNQDKIRELDGLAVILDNCNIDDHNPYICQWGIFTMRNLLDSNLENQAVVAAMERHGLEDTHTLRQFGVDVVEESGRIKIVPMK